MTQVSSSHAFVQWIKERLDEMDATIGAFEKQLASLSAEGQVKAQKIVEDIKNQRDIFVTKLKAHKAESDVAIQQAKAELTRAWDAFEVSSARYLDQVSQRVKTEHEAFRVRSEAQAKAWKMAVETLHKEANDLNSTAKKQADVFIEHLKAEADASRAKLEAVAKSQQHSWASFKSALTETRAAFDQAMEKSREAFKKVA